MAFTKDIGLSYARNAGADLSASLYYIAKIDTDGDIILATAGDAPCGVITEAAGLNEECTVQFGGIVKVSAGAAITAGAIVAAAADGQAVTATTGDYVLGVALQAAAGADEIISVMMGTAIGRAA